jgi:hypothetical protein
LNPLTGSGASHPIANPLTGSGSKYPIANPLTGSGNIGWSTRRRGPQLPRRESAHGVGRSPGAPSAHGVWEPLAGADSARAWLRRGSPRGLSAAAAAAAGAWPPPARARVPRHHRRRDGIAEAGGEGRHVALPVVSKKGDCGPAPPMAASVLVLFGLDGGLAQRLAGNGPPASGTSTAAARATAGASSPNTAATATSAAGGKMDPEPRAAGIASAARRRPGSGSAASTSAPSGGLRRRRRSPLPPKAGRCSAKRRTPWPLAPTTRPRASTTSSPRGTPRSGVRGGGEHHAGASGQPFGNSSAPSWPPRRAQIPSCRSILVEALACDPERLRGVRLLLPVIAERLEEEELLDRIHHLLQVAPRRAGARHEALDLPDARREQLRRGERAGSAG